MSHKKPELEAPESYWQATPQERAKICNGVGAAFLPKWLIDALNSPAFCWGISLRPAADIHDWEYYHGKIQEDKIQADKRFGRNMLKLIRFYSCLWPMNPLYYLRRWRTWQCYLAVRWGGDKAFWANK